MTVNNKQGWTINVETFNHSEPWHLFGTYFQDRSPIVWEIQTVLFSQVFFMTSKNNRVIRNVDISRGIFSAIFRFQHKSKDTQIYQILIRAEKNKTPATVTWSEGNEHFLKSHSLKWQSLAYCVILWHGVLFVKWLLREAPGSRRQHSMFQCLAVVCAEHAKTLKGTGII